MVPTRGSVYVASVIARRLRPSVGSHAARLWVAAALASAPGLGVPTTLVLAPTVGAAATLVLAPRGAEAQTAAEVTATPEAAAELFLRSVRAIRWGTAAQFVDPATLERFDSTVTMLSDADTTGDVRSYLTGTDSAGLAALDAAEVFDRSIGTMIDDMPGLMHSIFDRDDEVLGHVLEGPNEAHVVYRTMARISGAVPEVKVMQMRRGPDGWRVRWSDEFEVLDAALRGVPRGRRR